MNDNNRPATETENKTVKYMNNATDREKEKEKD